MTRKRDRKAFELARQYLLSMPGVTEPVLTAYLQPMRDAWPGDTMAAIYHRLLFSAQNANMKSGVIGDAIGGVEQLSRVLFGFDPQRTLEHYASWEDVLDRVEERLQPRGQIRRTSRSLWPHYCRTILSSAAFLTQFESAEDFHAWVRFFHDDPRARAALPLLMDAEIDGVGFALACDFLKELGYHEFSKPDVHIKDLFEWLGLCEGRRDLEVFRAVARVADAAGETAYGVDKIFWLIGSGQFYRHPEIGRIKGRKKEFCDFALPQLPD